MITDFIGGLEILSKYSDYISAEHDIVVSHTPRTRMSEEDCEKMIQHGWYPHEEYNGCWAKYV